MILHSLTKQALSFHLLYVYENIQIANEHLITNFKLDLGAFSQHPEDISSQRCESCSCRDVLGRKGKLLPVTRSHIQQQQTSDITASADSYHVLRSASFLPGTKVLLHSTTSVHSQKYCLTSLERDTACLNCPVMNNLNLLQRHSRSQSFFSGEAVDSTFTGWQNFLLRNSYTSSSFCKVKHIEKDLLDYRYS